MASESAHPARRRRYATDPGRRARTLAMTLLALAACLCGASPAVAQTPGFVIESEPVTGTRADDGATVVTVHAVNLSERHLRLALSVADNSCEPVAGEPQLRPYTSGQVTFTTTCAAGTAPRKAAVEGSYVTGTGDGPVPRSVPLRITLEPTGETTWPLFKGFVWTAVPLALLGVVPAYVAWLRSPRRSFWEKAGSREKAEGLGPWWAPRTLGSPLPGITHDWTLTENWASGVALACALFTTLFASADPFEALLGEGSAHQAHGIAVAAAIAAFCIASGPLWLTICKRRYLEHDGPRAENTVVGVLVGSFVVLVGALGFLYSVAHILDRPVTWASAFAVSVLFLIYTWKSVPQTLALGYFGRREEAKRAVSASL